MAWPNLEDQAVEIANLENAYVVLTQDALQNKTANITVTCIETVVNGTLNLNTNKIINIGTPSLPGDVTHRMWIKDFKRWKKKKRQRKTKVKTGNGKRKQNLFLFYLSF